MDDLMALADRFGAQTAEPVHVGCSGATVARLVRGSETLFYKSGPGVAGEADRLDWLSATGFPCPRLVARGSDSASSPESPVAWMLTTAVLGRDASQPWPPAVRPAVLTAVADALRELHSLPAAPFPPVYPPMPAAAAEPTVVTHGDYCLPNVLIDPGTLRFTGVVDVDDLGQGDPVIDLALMWRSITGPLNPQYGGRAAAEAFLASYGADLDEDRFAYYLALEDAGT